MFDPIQFEPLGGICVIAQDDAQSASIIRALGKWCDEMRVREFVTIEPLRFQDTAIVHVHANALLHESAPDADMRL